MGMYIQKINAIYAILEITINKFKKGSKFVLPNNDNNLKY